LGTLVGFLAAALAAPPAVVGDVPYVPTPPEVVAAMVRLAGVRSGDVVYDLGCGDGRIVIAAVQVRGVRGVCVDIDPERIHESRQNAQIVGVADRIRFVQGNLFEVPIEGATVVMIYLLPAVHLRLKPRLLNELRPGTRVVSHRFDMDDWKPQRRVAVELPPYHYEIYRWVVPMRGAARRP
jgi:ubiquinone/menaquinone biosynthesis C-methylase UbiE